MSNLHEAPETQSLHRPSELRSGGRGRPPFPLFSVSVAGVSPAELTTITWT